MNLEEKVWYACYGSNLLEERFLCYIKGGKPPGAQTNYEGCLDKTLPTEYEEFYICSELYFAQNSKTWDNGGVAFIRTNFESNASTFGKIYLITKGQLIDIAKQETNTKKELFLNFDKAIENGNYIFKKPSWYGNLMYLGEQNNLPIFTLTNENEVQTEVKPNEKYIKTIIDGLKQTHNLDNKTIFEYLNGKLGISGNYSDEELMDIIST
jgi:hypothetical protein